jgi:flagellar FliL protein
MIVVVAGGACALIIASAGFFALWSKVSAMEHMVSALQEETDEPGKAGAGAGIGPLYSLDTLIVNLGDQGGKRYLRVTMDLELKDPKLVEAIDQRLPQIKDSILTILPTKSVDEINSAAGKLALREELTGVLNGFLSKDAVTNIYFTEFVIQ